MPTANANPEVEVRCLRGEDLMAADRVTRLAFGTYLRLPEPTTFVGDAGSEADSRACYVKFGAVRPARDAESSFRQLMDAVELLADSRRLSRVVAGVNTSRHEAYCAMLARGFRTDIQGVAMQRPNADADSRGGLFVIDDWR